ncbi:Uncharacterised protein [Mycobacteroides abscessus subsp. abscessus]|nr:Uncharacterised protein [Mycobacteroides abscessus subsp. abscessus]
MSAPPLSASSASSCAPASVPVPMSLRTAGSLAFSCSVSRSSPSLKRRIASPCSACVASASRPSRMSWMVCGSVSWKVAVNSLSERRNTCRSSPLPSRALPSSVTVVLSAARSTVRVNSSTLATSCSTATGVVAPSMTEPSRR